MKKTSLRFLGFWLMFSIAVFGFFAYRNELFAAGRKAHSFSAQGKQGATITHSGIVADNSGLMDLNVDNIDKNMTISVQLVNTATRAEIFTDSYYAAGSRRYEVDEGTYELSVTVFKSKGKGKYAINLLMPEAKSQENISDKETETINAPGYSLAGMLNFPVDINSQMSFTEPVVNAISEVSLWETGGSEAPLKTTAVGNYASSGAVVIGDRAYVPEYLSYASTPLHVIDISDPSQMQEKYSMNLPSSVFSMDGIAASPLTGRPLMSVLARFNSGYDVVPFLYFVGVEGDEVKPVGATTLTYNSLGGDIKRVKMHRNMAYTSVSNGASSDIGLYVIDVGKAINDWQIVRTQYTEAQARGLMIDRQNNVFRSSIVNKISTGVNGTLSTVLADITADDFVYGGQSQPLVLATGLINVPLMVVNPANTGSSAMIYAANSIATPLGALVRGVAITTGRVGNMPLALVTGGVSGGSASNALAIFDMTDPESPVLTGVMELEAPGFSVLMENETAYVGTRSKTFIVNLHNPANPVVEGVIEDFGSKLASQGDGYLYAVDQVLTVGIKAASLGGVVPPSYGDISGDGYVNMADVMQFSRYLADWDNIVINESAADLDADGFITLRDLLVLRRHFANWEGYETLPLRVQP